MFSSLREDSLCLIIRRNQTADQLTDYRSVNSIAETETLSKNLWELGVCFSTLLNPHTMVSCLFHDLQRRAFFSTSTALDTTGATEEV